MPLEPRQHFVQLAEESGQEPQQARLLEYSIQARPLQKTSRCQCPARPPGIRRDVEEQQSLENRQWRLYAGLRHVHAKRLDQLSVLHSGRTGRLARAAIKTQIEVPANFSV